MSGINLFAWQNGLELDTHAELNPAAAGNAIGWDELRSDHTEASGVGQVEARVVEDHIVEGIEEIEGKGYRHGLFDLCLLAQRHICVPA